MRLPKDKKSLQEAITGFLMQKIGEGSLTDREGVLRALQSDLGLSVARITPNSISIKDPTNENGRNIRLKGEIYADTFRFSQDHFAENERASREYRANRIKRIAETRAELTTEIERKREFNIQRYSEPRKEFKRANQQDISLQNSFGGHNWLVGGSHTGVGGVQSISSQEYHQETGRTSRNTAKHRAITPTSQDFEQNSDWRERRQIFHSIRTPQSRNLQIDQEQPSNDISEQIRVSHAQQQLFERLQRIVGRTRLPIKNATDTEHQAERADRAIADSQSRLEGTERAITGGNSQINSTEQQIKQREQQANELATEQQKALANSKGFGFGR